MPSFYRVFECYAATLYGMILLNLGFVAALPFVMELVPGHLQGTVLLWFVRVDFWPVALSALVYDWLFPAAHTKLGLTTFLLILSAGWLAVPYLVAVVRPQSPTTRLL